MPRLLPPLLLALAIGPVFAAPELTVEANGAARTSGSTLRLASEFVSQVTDPIEFPLPEGPLSVAFPNVVPGDYFGQVSFGGDIFSEVTGLIVHPAAGTLTFSHDPGPVPTAFYRLSRVIDSCVEITIRNTGDAPLTGIGASLSGDDFTLDAGSLATSLAPAGTTTLTVCFASTEAGAHPGTLEITSDAGSFTLALVGENDPGPIIVVPPVPVITVIGDRSAFNTAVGPGQMIDDFSGTTPLLNVTTTNGAIQAGRWFEIARSSEPPTVWQIPFGTTGWGGTWDLTEAGAGGGLAFDVDFGDGNFVPVPGHIPGDTAADAFFGFTTDVPFYAVRVRLFNLQVQETHTVDDLSVAIPISGEIAVHDGPTTAAPQLNGGQPAPLDFGTLAHNTPASRTLTIANNGSDALTVYALTVGEKFQIANAPALPFSITPGGSVNIDVIFNSANGGNFESRVAVWSSDADETRFDFADFAVTATVTPDVRLQLINSQNGAEVTDGQPTIIAIQPNAFGGGSSVSLNLNNIGLDPLVVSSVSLPAGFQTSKTLPLTIQPGQSDFLSITSVGPTAGYYEGNVTLTTNDSVKTTLTFPISALFNMPEIAVGTGFFGSTELTNGGTLDVGTTRLGATGGFSLRVRNLHAALLTVSGVTLPAGYAISAPVPTFPFTLGKDQVRDINFSIVTTTPGTFSGTLSIHNNDFDEGPFNIQLTGTVSPESILFFGFSTFIEEGGQVSAFGSGSGPVTYQWDLDGDGEFDDATGSSVPLPDSDGPGTFAASVRLTDNLTTMTRTASIPIVNRTPFPQPSAPQNIIAGDTLLLNVLTSDAPVDLAAGMTWRIAWSEGGDETTAAGHPATTSFSRVLSQPGRANIGIEVTDKDGATGSTQVSVWVRSAVFGVFNGPDTVSPELRDGESSLSFSTLAGGTQDRPLTVLNRSTSPATIGPVTLPAGFTLVAPPAFPATISPGATLPLTLRFAPPVGGSYGGPLAMATSDPLMPVFDLQLSGAAAAPDIVVNQFSNEHYDFASEERSLTVDPGTQPFTGLSINLESGNSNAPLIISAIDLPPNFQFEVAPVFPMDFSSGDSRDIRIQCNGASPGFYKGWVSIHSNDPDESPFRFFVRSRVGEVADLLVKSDDSDPSSATGIILNGQSDTPALPLQLRLHNQGHGSVTVSAITLPEGFGFASPPALPITLNLFGSSTLPEIVLTATAPGTYGGQVVITSTDPDENPFQFTLSATVPGGEPPPSELTSFTLVPASSTTGAVFSGDLSGPPGATVIIEGSRDLGESDLWTEVTRVTLDAAGQGTVSPTPAPGSIGAARFFVRLRLLSP
jgi:hypothetical protein